MHGQLGIPLSLPEIDGLGYHFMWQFFPVIYLLGEAWIYISSAFMFLLVLKLLVGATVRGFLAFKKYGCGRWVIFSLWETLFIIVTTPWRLLSKTAEALTADLDDNGIYNPQVDTVAQAPPGPRGEGGPPLHQPAHGAAAPLLVAMPPGQF